MMVDEAKKLQKIVEQCTTGNTGKACERITPEEKCEVYLFPFSKWRVGNCPMCTNVTKDLGKTKGRVGQQKQKKKDKKHK